MVPSVNRYRLKMTRDLHGQMGINMAKIGRRFAVKPRV